MSTDSMSDDSYSVSSMSDEDDIQSRRNIIGATTSGSVSNSLALSVTTAVSPLLGPRSGVSSPSAASPLLGPSKSPVMRPSLVAKLRLLKESGTASPRRQPSLDDYLNDPAGKENESENEFVESELENDESLVDVVSRRRNQTTRTSNCVREEADLESEKEEERSDLDLDFERRLNFDLDATSHTDDESRLTPNGIEYDSTPSADETVDTPHTPSPVSSWFSSRTMTKSSSAHKPQVMPARRRGQRRGRGGRSSGAIGSSPFPLQLESLLVQVADEEGEDADDGANWGQDKERAAVHRHRSPSHRHKSPLSRISQSQPHSPLPASVMRTRTRTATTPVGCVRGGGRQRRGGKENEGNQQYTRKPNADPLAKVSSPTAIQKSSAQSSDADAHTDDGGGNSAAEAEGRLSLASFPYLYIWLCALGWMRQPHDDVTQKESSSFGQASGKISAWASLHSTISGLAPAVVTALITLDLALSLHCCCLAAPPDRRSFSLCGAPTVLFLVCLLTHALGYSVMDATAEQERETEKERQQQGRPGSGSGVARRHGSKRLGKGQKARSKRPSRELRISSTTRTRARTRSASAGSLSDATAAAEQTTFAGYNATQSDHERNHQGKLPLDPSEHGHGHGSVRTGSAHSSKPWAPPTQQQSLQPWSRALQLPCAIGGDEMLRHLEQDVGQDSEAVMNKEGKDKGSDSGVRRSTSDNGADSPSKSRRSNLKASSVDKCLSKSLHKSLSKHVRCRLLLNSTVTLVVALWIIYARACAAPPAWVPVPVPFTSSAFGVPVTASVLSHRRRLAAAESARRSTSMGIRSNSNSNSNINSNSNAATTGKGRLNAPPPSPLYQREPASAAEEKARAHATADGGRPPPLLSTLPFLILQSISCLAALAAAPPLLTLLSLDARLHSIAAHGFIGQLRRCALPSEQAVARHLLLDRSWREAVSRWREGVVGLGVVVAVGLAVVAWVWESGGCEAEGRQQKEFYYGYYHGYDYSGSGSDVVNVDNTADGSGNSDQSFISPCPASCPVLSASLLFLLLLLSSLLPAYRHLHSRGQEVVEVAGRLYHALVALPPSSRLRRKQLGKDYDPLLLYLRVVGLFGRVDGEAATILRSIHSEEE